MSVLLIEGDSLEVLPRLAADGVQVHAVVCDPPYHLVSIHKRFAKSGGADRKPGAGPYHRHAKGFMGKEWDGGAVAFRPETWVKVASVLRPGGHVVAFGGPRTAHRLAVAIEDAGLEIRDSILDLVASDAAVQAFARTLDPEQAEAFIRCLEDSGFGGLLAWVFGSGFPKSHDISKAIDKGFRRDESGQDYEWRPASGPSADVYAVTAFIRAARDKARRSNGEIDRLFGFNGMAGHWTSQASQPMVPTWPQWERLKALLNFGDAMDEMVVALNGGKGDRSIEGTALADRDVVGTAIGKDAVAGDLYAPGSGTYIRKEYDLTDPATAAAKFWAGWGTAIKPAWEPIIVARKPLVGTVAANVLAHGTGALNIDGCRIATDGEDITAGLSDPANRKGEVGGAHTWTRLSKEEMQARQRAAIDQDNRLGRWPANVVHDGSPEVLAAFGAFGDRAPSPFASATTVGRRNVYSDGPGADYSGRGYTDSGSAARFFYSSKAGAEDRWGSKHPTVKPVALMRWLARLVCPPGGTVLDPFAGSGSTGVAAIAEGLDAVLIEREAEYAADIRARIAFYEGEGRHSLASKGRKVSADKAAGADAPLFRESAQ